MPEGQIIFPKAQHEDKSWPEDNFLLHKIIFATGHDFFTIDMVISYVP